MQRAITIKDVAQKAKVGIATVSRVLNHSRRVDPATRRRIERVIAQLGYRPNATGRRLVTRSTEMVCFLLANREFMNPFHSGVLYGVEREVSRMGLDVVFSNLHYQDTTAPDELALPRILSHRGIVDGFILSGTNYPNLIAAMDRLGAPYVMFGNNLVGVGAERRPDAVYYDDAETAAQIVERLIAFGHRHIWYYGDPRMPWFQRRGEIYSRVMAAHGLPPRWSTSAAELRDYGVAYGATCMDELLVRGEPVTAVVAGNDGIAYGAWQAIRRAGLRVPSDLSLVGFDDVQESRLTDPPLTSVHVPTEEIGRACAQLLWSKLQSKGAPQPPVALGTRLVERESWGPPPTRN